MHTIMCLLFLHHVSQSLVVAQYIKAEYEKSPMTEAFLNCQKEGGHLVSIEEFRYYAEEIREQCYNIKQKYYWIGNYSIITPFMSLEGCFEYKDLNTMTFNITGNSIAKCYARCTADVGIAMMDNSCQCITENGIQLETSQQIDAQLCDIYRDREILGGLLSAMAVYLRREGDFSTNGINPYCFFGKCDGGRYWEYQPCSDANIAKVVCSNNASGNTAASWWEAMDECITNHHRYPLTSELFLQNTKDFCSDNDNTLMWTNEREYRDQIIIQDIGVKENLIFTLIKVCKVANLIDLSTRETGICNNRGIENHGYLCYVDAPKSPALNSTSCIVNLSSTTTEQSSVTSEGTSPTTKVTYEMTQFITTEYSEMNTDPNFDVTSGTTNAGGNSSPESTDENYRDEISAQNSVNNVSQGLSLGVIIGGAVGGGVVLSIAVVTMIIIKRRFRSEGKAKRTTSSGKISLSKRQSAIYVENNEENYMYDVLNKRKQRLSQVRKVTENVYAHATVGQAKNVENAYDSTFNLINTERDSAYETCLIGPERNGDATYDLSVRGENGETVKFYERPEDDAYDSSETVGTYSNSGAEKADQYQEDTGVYEQCGSLQEVNHGGKNKHYETGAVNKENVGTPLQNDTCTDMEDVNGTAIYATVKKFKNENQK